MALGVEALASAELDAGSDGEGQGGGPEGEGGGAGGGARFTVIVEEELEVLEILAADLLTNVRVLVERAETSAWATLPRGDQQSSRDWMLGESFLSCPTGLPNRCVLTLRR